MSSMSTATSTTSAGDPVILADIDFTLSQLAADVCDARDFYTHIRSTSIICPEKGLVNTIRPDWAPRLIRRLGIAGAVVDKAGSRAYVKRRPEDTSAFLDYVQKQTTAQLHLLFRVGFGPLKNVNHCGQAQDPDWAEYLAFTQLARMMLGISGIYPHGVKVQIVPDDLRTCHSNLCPETYAARYIAGLRELARNLELDGFIAIEDGQARLYAHYDVPAHHEKAEQALASWRTSEPEAFAIRWAAALDNAGKNLFCANDRSTEEIESAAWRYLVAHKAEMLSGLWSPGDAFPLRYANHPNSYQLYTIGFKKTKLPWQISLPGSLLGEPHNMRITAQ